MRIRINSPAVLLLMIGLSTGCGDSTKSPKENPPAPVDTKAPASVPAVSTPPTPAEVLGCLKGKLSGATASEISPLPSGATGGVNVDVPRPDLPKGINRISVIAFGRSADAEDFSRGSGAFLGPSGGRSEVVGASVISYPFPGDDAVVAITRSCVTP